MEINIRISILRTKRISFPWFMLRALHAMLLGPQAHEVRASYLPLGSGSLAPSALLLFHFVDGAARALHAPPALVEQCSALPKDAFQTSRCIPVSVCSTLHDASRR